MIPAGQGHRPRLQRICSRRPVGRRDLRMKHSSLSRFAQRSGLQWIVALRICTSPAVFAEIKASDCARAAKYLRNQARQCDAGNANGRTFLSITQMVGLATDDGAIFSGTKSFWELRHWRLCKRAPPCLDSTIRCRTRLPSGRVTRGNRQSRFGIAQPNRRY